MQKKIIAKNIKINSNKEKYSILQKKNKWLRKLLQDNKVRTLLMQYFKTIKIDENLFIKILKLKQQRLIIDLSCESKYLKL